MLKTKLFIPKKIKIGFQNRSDTFTGKLGYVIYFDERNKLRKQTSWDGWRDHKIEPMEYENKPQNGFVLNRGVERYSDWGSSRAVVRVYDSRDFEFEISIDNLLGILMHSDVSKRDIVEQCVFAWHGADLILLPCNSVEYQESVEYTAKQDMKVSTKELIPGRRYHKKKSDEILIYMGRWDWWEIVSADPKNRYCSDKKHINKGKKHIFYDECSKSFQPISVSILSSEVSQDIVQDYAFLVDQFFETINSQPIKDIVVVPYDTVIDDERHIRNIPHLGRYKDGKIITLFARSYSTLRSLHSFDLNYNVKEITFGDSLSYVYKAIEVRSHYSYRPDIQRSFSITPEMVTEICETGQQLGYDINKLSPAEYVKILTEIGYGMINYVLQNDKQINDANYYYY